MDDDLSKQSIFHRVIYRIWNSGSVCILIAATIFSIANLQVKQISNKVPSLETILFRAVGSLVLTMIYAYTKKVPNILGTKDKIIFLVFRGVTGTVSMCTYYFAIEYLHLSEAVTIAFLNPLIIVPWAYFLFHDKVGWRSLLGIATALVGVVLIQRPPFLFSHDEEDHNIHRTIGLLMAFNSAFFTSLSFIQIRIIGTSEDPIVINLYYYIISVIAATISAIIKIPKPFVVPDPKAFADLISISLLSFFAQVFTARGFQIGQSAIVASVNFIQVFYSQLADLFIFHAHLKLLGVLGSLCVFAGIILVNHEKTVRSKEKQDALREELITQRTLSQDSVESESLEEGQDDDPQEFDNRVKKQLHAAMLRTHSEIFNAH